MPRLKDRNRQTPGGHKFYDPVLKYRSRPWASIDDIARGLVSARLGNPALTQQHGWSTDFDTVANEVDQTIARHCQQMGWKEFIVADAVEGGTGPPPNFQQPPQRLRLLGRLKNVAAGASLSVEWLGSGEKAVPIKVAEERASVCAGCEFNGKGGFTSYFTVPISNAIHKAIEKREQLKLKTSQDDHLNICEICLCPLKLKVFSPIALILSKMPNDVREALPKYCWIVREAEQGSEKMEGEWGQ